MKELVAGGRWPVIGGRRLDGWPSGARPAYLSSIHSSVATEQRPPITGPRSEN